ncbi:MAG: hypothetical protein K8S99_11590 [Planctomycetes bacterium]|nr:hypothetical protein [Planctomycetota bacterium]
MPGKKISYEQYLRNAAVPRAVIDTFLDAARPRWAQFNPDTGYTLGNSMPHDGLDGCWTISTAQKNSARAAHMYADRPCRINTYGNSFTQCHQVSDGETWQEYLAGHLGEPVRNFGMGGYGVYQSYRRMVRTERSRDGGKYVLLYIWGDDHFRSVMRCRHAAIYPWWDHRGGLMFHNNFWANLEMDLGSRRLVEKENLLPTPESLYKMTDADFMADALRDDLMLQLCTVEHVDPASLDVERLGALAEILRVPPIDTSTADALKTSAHRLKTAYGFAATKHIIDLAMRFCRENGRELMILLLCPTATWNLLWNEPRYEQEIADYLVEKKQRHFDMNPVHLADYKCFRLSPEEYMKRYFIGHYGPAGNHFFAYALKNRLVEWLDPKPVTYRDDGSSAVGFDGYLPG